MIIKDINLIDENLVQDWIMSFLLSNKNNFKYRNPNQIALELKKANGNWYSKTYQEIFDESIKLSLYFKQLGIEKGDRIVIFHESGPEWASVFIATLRCGAILVPLDIKSTSFEIEKIINDCQPKFVLSSSEAKENFINFKTVEQIIDLDNNALLEEIKPEDITDITNINININIKDTVLIIYTSGTTGNSKGVMISLGNLIFQIKIIRDFTDFRDSIFLSILPLNHLFEFVCGFLAPLIYGVKVCYIKSLSPKEILKAMQEKKITHMIVVPMFLKVLKIAIQKEIKNLNFFKQLLLNLLFSFSSLIKFKIIRKILFTSIHEKFGGEMRGFICGGAPLNIEISKFFELIGIPIYEGYGLSEASPIVSFNSDKYYSLSSVGKPLRGSEIKITEQGEICVKGPHIMNGYYKRPDLTAEIIDSEGWLHTGDIGYINEKGFLYITGRIKNLIVLAGGKKVQPEEVEEVLSKIESIKEICILGIKERDTEEVWAIASPQDELVEKYKDNLNKLEELISGQIKDQNYCLAPYKRPLKIIIKNIDFPKTHTRKIKRNELKSYLLKEIKI